jgi:hypothetical protein
MCWSRDIAVGYRSLQAGMGRQKCVFLIQIYIILTDYLSLCRNWACFSGKKTAKGERQAPKFHPVKNSTSSMVI